MQRVLWSATSLQGLGLSPAQLPWLDSWKNRWATCHRPSGYASLTLHPLLSCHLAAVERAEHLLAQRVCLSRMLDSLMELVSSSLAYVCSVAKLSWALVQGDTLNQAVELAAQAVAVLDQAVQHAARTCCQ